MRADLREKIDQALAVGDDDFDGVVEEGVYYLEDQVEDAGALKAAAEEMASEAFAAYVDRQRTWPEVLDADRLIRAFRELDTTGIVARANFACCQSCGTAEIGGEVPDGGRMRGYVFCHRQDVDAAVAGQGLYLSYGAFGDDRSQDAGIGEEVTEALRRHGLTAVWDGDVAVRIDVPMTWRRRRFGRLAAWPGAPEPDGGDLKVTYCDYWNDSEQAEAVPMSLGECGRVLLDLTPRTGNFATFGGRGGDVIQVMWEDGPRLWLESPDPASRCSRGRYVTLAEAEELIGVLAREDRVDLARLGDVETRPWG